MDLIESMTPIGDILIEDGTISRDQLSMALLIQEPARKSGQILVDKGIMSRGTFQLMLEVLLTEIIVDLGYASEEDIFGPLRAGIVLDGSVEIYDDEEKLEDLSDF